MRAALVLMVGMIFWLMTPALSDAHQVKQKDHDRHGYSQKQNDHRGYDAGYKQHHQKQHRHQKQGWKKHRKDEKRWARHNRHQRPVKVIYRDRWPYPLFPRIVIHLPL